MVFASSVLKVLKKVIAQNVGPENFESFDYWSAGLLLSTLIRIIYIRSSNALVHIVCC